MDEVSAEPWDFTPAADLLAEANAILGAHWRRPEEEWRPMCEQCAYGTCPQLIWAEARLVRFARRGW